MSFMIYDVTFLLAFVIFVSFFLYKGKKNLKRDGILALYPTKWGIKLINSVGKKYQKTLQFLSYISISIGYLLMAGILYSFGKIVWIYAFMPDVVKAIKIPPIMPLIPYLPQAFKLDFLPPFYFTYWILIIALIAVTHEFAHGIFAAKDKVKIKKTGFGFFPYFFPIFLAAFVELDEKQMSKKSKFSQMAVLSAGTFANFLTGVLFFIILVLFFSTAYAPSGVIFDDYVSIPVEVSAISSINGIALQNHTIEEVSELIDPSKDNKIISEGKLYEGIGINPYSLDSVKLYEETPALEYELTRGILKINNIPVTTPEELSYELSKYSKEDTITINLLEEDGTNYDQDVKLDNYYSEENPLGIVFSGKENTGTIVSWLTSFKKSHTYYLPKMGELNSFIYNFLWWTVLISFSVALVNMLPLGIFDGGRFFYLTIWSLTKNKRKAEKSFKFMTHFLLYLLLLIMVFWAIRIF